MLLLWLFGVGAGVANACLAPALTLLAGTDAGQARGVAHHDGNHRVGEHADLHEHDAPVSAAKANCQDFCDKSTVSVPPLKSAVGEVDAHPLPPQVAATVLQVPAVQAAMPWVPRRDGGLAPPIPIAFLRLAL